MRSFFVLGLLMTMCASANAATVHHHRTRHHVIIRPGVASNFATVPTFAFAPPPVHYEDTPALDSATGLALTD
jgi:hypothetical protein